MTKLISGFWGEVQPTSYVTMVEMINAYYGIAEAEGLPDSDVYVMMYELFTGGFEVNSGTFDHHEAEGDEPARCLQVREYVDIPTAKRLLDAGIVKYGGRSDSFEEALKVMETNALPHDPEEYVLAYGGYHPAHPYEEARDMMLRYRETAAKHGGNAIVRLAGTTTGYEIVAVIDNQNGMLDDSEYVSESVAKRLVDDGLCTYMEFED